MKHGTGILSCACCGDMIRNDKRENVSHGVTPYPHDKGYGMCRNCGGDSRAKSVKKRMGWGLRCFVEARFAILRERLKPRQQRHWDGLTYEQKAVVIMRMVEKGVMT